MARSQHARLGSRRAPRLWAWQDAGMVRMIRTCCAPGQRIFATHLATGFPVSSNSTGKLFTVTTFGESHGPAIGCVIDGCPPGLPIEADEFRTDLERRATGRSRHTSQRHESDDVEILSGVYQGRTTGTPIALLIRNTDQRSKDYGDIVETFRPGHADYTYWQKYGIRDPRGGGRSSARETTMRVAAAVIAKKWLAERYGVRVRGYLAQIGESFPKASTGMPSNKIRSSGRTKHRCLPWRNTWTRCASPAIPSARV